jgi:hypothetical protein
MIMDHVTWWTAFGAIAQALGAIATFAAVIVSLRIASAQRSLRASASVGILVTFEGDGSPGEYHVGFNVLNQSMQSIHVSSLGWRTGWIRKAPQALGFRWAVQSGIGDEAIKCPYELAPNRSATTLSPIRLVKAPEAGATGSIKHIFDRRVPVIGWAPIRGVVSITGRRPLFVKPTPELAAFLRTGEHPSFTDEPGGLTHSGVG